MLSETQLRLFDERGQLTESEQKSIIGLRERVFSYCIIAARVQRDKNAVMWI